MCKLCVCLLYMLLAFTCTQKSEKTNNSSRYEIHLIGSIFHREFLFWVPLQITYKSQLNMVWFLPKGVCSHLFAELSIAYRLASWPCVCVFACVCACVCTRICTCVGVLWACDGLFLVSWTQAEALYLSQRVTSSLICSSSWNYPHSILGTFGDARCKVIWDTTVPSHWYSGSVCLPSTEGILVVPKLYFIVLGRKLIVY